ncbi:methyl-accepting chemotaxis protein [Sphingomonas sp. ABOLD]|nr:methyl-accepting chemotaxis protein [Sphingomonas trueperi]RSV43587.1 methyl-accepting chemotaxis protein [Sphingomonas sp. ABOLE]RSV53015.1 methyl-accepting chemotaxis protein [Sphingomonas sp. ABOLD]
MEADMMHDAVRSDVLAILASSEPGIGIKLEDARKDLDEHLGTLRTRIAEDVAFKGDAAIEAAAAKVGDPMVAYANAAQQIADAAAAGNPAAAKRQLPGFFQQFSVLEDSMAAASDAIEHYSDGTAKAGATLGWITTGLLAATLLAAIGGALYAARLARRRLVDPLIALSDTVEKLVTEPGTPLPETDRQDELGALARSIAQFNQQVEAANAEKQATTELIVETVGSGLQKLAGGDLTTHVDADLSGPFARLKQDFNVAVDSLRTLIGSVHSGAGSLRRASTEITAASEDLARRTEANAASLETTTAEISQIDERLRTSVRAASETVGRADQTIEAVSSGRARVSNAVTAMSRVSESAKGIDAVIEGLDKIAFQTRVLAMNAAVEAGRAGEAGRGFAVVADLVSALAMRAEEEAGRARDQLTVTQVEIGTAVAAVEDVDGAFSSISENAQSVHKLLGQVAADNRVQSESISRLSETIRVMDNSTQQNAAMVEETSAAARNLMAEIGQLVEQAGQFRIEGGGAAAPAWDSGRTAYALPVASVSAISEEAWV